MLEKFFELKKHGTTVRTEIVAGITTFVAMSYIIFVNPPMLAMGNVQIQNGVFFATCIAAFIGTALMGLMAKLPFAQASGMGLNAFFAYTVMAGMGYSYNEVLAIVFISGMLFIAITIFGLREAIVRAIPKNIKIAISAGIGLFLALLGFKNAGIVVANSSTLVGLADFSALAKGDQAAKLAVTGAVISIVGLVLIAALSTLRVKGAILIGILACTLLGVPFGVTVLPENFSVDFGVQFSDFMQYSLFQMDFAGLFAGSANLLAAIGTIAMLVISFSLVDMFDTIGTLLGTAKKANLLDENGNMPGMTKALLCDAIATSAGAMLGTSTVTTYVESSAGVAEGGRTGLTACTTAVCFLLALVVAPFVSIVPACATAPALIYVGGLMLSSVLDLETGEDMSELIPAFLTIAMMPMTYSIANGIAFGLISYVLIKLLCGRWKEINLITVIISALFILRFFVIAM